MLQLRRRFKKIFINLFYRQLWTKIAIVFLVIVTIPVISLGLLLINSSRHAVRNSVLNNHKQIVTRAASEIGLFIERPESVLKATAAMLGRIHVGSWEQETILVELVLNQPEFMRVISVDDSGKIIAGSDMGNDLNKAYPQKALLYTQKNQTYLSKVKFLDNHTPYMTIAVPVKTMGKVRRALIADVNLRQIWRIIDGIQLDKTGRAFLVSDNGIIIAHQDKQKVLKNENFSQEKDVKAVLSGAIDAIELKDSSGQQWVSSYAPVRSLGWGIVLRQKQEEAYLFSNVFTIQSWILIILAELAGILVSIFIAKAMVVPIKAFVLRFKNVADGGFAEAVGIKRKDELGDLVKSFNRMTEELRKAKSREHFTAIGESVTRVAHELKNSLVPIKSFIYLFPRKYGDEKFIDKFSKLMPNEINRWERMIKDLSSFSVAEKLIKLPTDIGELMQNTLEMMEERFSKNQIKVICEAGCGTFKIEADEERLKQVFINLILNSINAMPEGGLLEVSIDDISSSDLLPKQEYVQIKVKDTGKGIMPEELGKIFDPFHTTTKGGMGLGLAISKKIVKQHGGVIDVESVPGKGTIFIIRLPKEKIESKV
ncbi:MAG: ATP-binding protein [Candidatus Omnitrophota bacterium]